MQQRLRKRPAHIFHFIGHGGWDEHAEDGLLLFEDDYRRGYRVSANRLATILHDHQSLQLVVLNACEGARTSPTDPFAGVAATLVQQGIPAVVAMQFEITDRAAVDLAQVFYESLADGYPAEAALAEARKAIFASGNDVEWGTPVLYLRAPDGRLFEVSRRSSREAAAILMAQRKAEKDRLAREEPEQDRLAKTKTEAEGIAREKSEQESRMQEIKKATSALLERVHKISVRGRIIIGFVTLAIAVGLLASTGGSLRGNAGNPTAIQTTGAIAALLTNNLTPSITHTPRTLPTNTATQSPTATITSVPKTPTFRNTPTVMPVFTPTPRRLNPTDTPYPPTATNASQLIIFVLNRDIHTKNADGSDVRNLTAHPADDVLPALSPDGTRIAFGSNRDENWEIYVMNLDGSDLTNLTNHPANEGEGLFRFPFSWSPDGTRIAFTTDRDGNREVYIMNSNGSGQTNLTNISAFDCCPEWLSDRRIVFYSYRDGTRVRYAVNTDGSELTRLPEP